MRGSAPSEVGPAATENGQGRGSTTAELSFASGVDLFGSELMLRGWVKAPARAEAASGIVFYCLAGGGCSTGYFDTQVAGWPDYSLADHLVCRGAVVIAVDHPGIGRSDPVGDIYTVTPTVVAACHGRITAQVRARIACGDLVPGYPPVDPIRLVGVGHSMGGLLAVVQQAHHRSFDAMVLLGHGSGLPEQLTDEELGVAGDRLASVEGAIEALARRRFDPAHRAARKPLARGAFFTDSVPGPVREQFAAQRVPLLPTCGLTSMIPGVTSSERSVIDVPTFFGFGDHDLIDDYLGCVAQFGSLTDVAVYVLADSGHCHNQATGRRLLWDRIHEWSGVVAPVSGPAEQGVDGLRD